jgi:hypothetical protein
MYKYFHLEISINTKKFSFMIAIENLKTILFFSFKIEQHSNIYDKNIFKNLKITCSFSAPPVGLEMFP